MTQHDAQNPVWFHQLLEVLQAGFNPDGPSAGGAELTVTEPDGTIRYRHPLARHARLDTDCVWIRPIVGEGPSFDLNDCRRRGLPTDNVTATTTGDIEFALGDGDTATAVVRSARTDLHPILDRWDTFVLAELSATDELALAELTADTWGP